VDLGLRQRQVAAHYNGERVVEQRAKTIRSRGDVCSLENGGIGREQQSAVMTEIPQGAVCTTWCRHRIRTLYPVLKSQFLKASTVLNYDRNTQTKLSIFFSF
jgi:hypothetical protein